MTAPEDFVRGHESFDDHAGNRRDAASLGVDMTSSADMKHATRTLGDEQRSSGESKGQLTFTNPFGEGKAHGWCDGGAQDNSSSDAGSDASSDASDSTTNVSAASLDLQLVQELAQLASEVQQLTAEISQLLGTQASENGASTSDNPPPSTASGGGDGSGTVIGGSGAGDDGGGGSDSAVQTPPTVGSTGSDSSTPTTVPPADASSSSGPASSASGSDSSTPTDAPGSIPGVTSANNAALAAANPGLQGQGTGPDALYLGPVNSNLVSIDEQDQGFSQKYGYFEADVKTEAGGAGAPGWWMESLAHAEDPTGTPSVEMDILEAQLGLSGSNYYGTLHKDSSVFAPSTDDQQNPSLIQTSTNFADGYNVFGFNWQPDDPNVEWYLNGKEVASAPKYDDTDTSSMFMNIGNSEASWGPGFNPTDVTGSDSDTSQYASVKWVRVYQDAGLVNNTNDPGGTLGTTINDTNAADAPPSIPGVNWENTFNYDFTNGQPSLSDDGGQDNTVWTDRTQDLPAGSWWQQGIAVGPASVGDGTSDTFQTGQFSS